METKEHGKQGKKKVILKPKSLKYLRRKSQNYHKDDGTQCCYGTDEEEYVYRTVHRYSATTFPLFSNMSDDEVIKKSKSKQFQTKEVKSASQATSQQSKPQAGCNPTLLPQSQVKNGENQTLDIFPFQSLPYELKNKVFTYLNHVDKGLSMRVCREWKELLANPVMWSTVMLGDFPMSCMPSENHQQSSNCYLCYNERVHRFARYLQILNPPIKHLDFKFDIGEPDDNYLEILQNFLTKGNLQSLGHFNFNWKETPTRPFWSEWSNCNDIVFRQRYRGRLFVYFFDDLTKVAKKITTLLLPFDWSDRSVMCLTRLQNLHTLVIEKYFVFQAMKQDLLDKLMDGLPNLERLMLEVWSPSGPGLIPYTIRSKSLEFLDISQSRGFYLQALDIPKMKRFRVARRPWNGPLVCADRIALPCLYNTLVEGAPALSKLNDHYLEESWKDNIYPTLEEVLKVVCSCRKHKIGWAM
ncbi:uncharacterized protein LOC110445665 [Mizuhopecten yessoensis]|uniref:F-box domain-containing protein n=1 Tax=Mizuhopecten yessoensis TaxID=6573 RepID=A0A210QZE6_MIZYE|nr:uncharacterized protein LOC110445665 [Mizuhopecten yessoensis]OWF54082.1 hypothetical protein KP79_PYT25435 [Mizuhopecten yessoensis]